MLVRFFCVFVSIVCDVLRMKKALVIKYTLNTSEDSGITGWMPRLIRVFALCTLTVMVLLCHSSYTCILGYTTKVICCIKLSLGFATLHVYPCSTQKYIAEGGPLGETTASGG